MRSLVLSNAPEPLELNREKLLTTSDFNVLTFLYEANELAELFSAKFWKSISYGSVNWSLVPLVSDILAIAEQINNAWKQAVDDEQLYEDEITTDVDIKQIVDINSAWDLEVRLTGKYVRRLTGHITIPDNPLLELFDRWGFHPDVSTLWDVIPGSFLVDYILPIGDQLDKLTNRGWIKAVNFTGWSTLSFEGELHIGDSIVAPSIVEPYRSSYSYRWSGNPHLCRYFSRTRLNSVCLLDLPEEMTTPKDYDPPSFREMFNLLYVGLGDRKGRW
jgi:hypothetical protein